MTNNERIAEWLRAKEADSDLGNLEVGDIVLKPDGGELFSVGYITEQVGGKMASYRPWSPDTDITLWHGDSGIFSEIYKHGHDKAVMFVFYLRDVLKMEKGEANFWKYITATPAQLSAALVKMIEEVKQ